MITHQTNVSLNYAAFPRDHPKINSDWYRFYRLLDWLQRSAPGVVTPTARWLDIGCHSGSFLRAVVQIFGVKAVGCDVYPVNDKEQKKYECYQLTENSGWEYRQLDVSDGIKFPETFDVISALELIEHIIDTDEFLNQVRDHLAPRGLFVATTPNISNLRNRLCVPFGSYPIGLEYRNVIHHVRLYNVAAIRSHFAEHRFEVLAVKGVQLLPRRWIENSSFFRFVSEAAADAFPQLAPNIIVISRKGS